jgi:hypothetical protein
VGEGKAKIGVWIGVEEIDEEVEAELNRGWGIKQW